MDNIAYVCRGEDAHATLFEVPLITVKATAFSNDVPALIASYRKLICMNMKQSNRIRFLNRQGKYAETDVSAPVLRHLVSSEGLLDHCAFFAVGGEELVRLRPVNQANGYLSIDSNSLTLDEELFAVAVGNGGIVYALGRTQVFEVDMDATVKRAAIELPSKTTVKYPTIAFHQEANMLLAPARRNCLDLISTATRKSVLPKVWEPHSSSVPTAAFFIQRRSFANEAPDQLFIVTAACGNREVRLWCYNKATRTFLLKQEVSITFADDAKKANSPSGDTSAEENDDDALIISCTPNEEYITFTSKKHSLAVVLEMHRTSFKVNHVTSWRMQGPVLCSVSSVGKVADSAASGLVGYQLVIIVRTATGFYEEVLDVAKLAGASDAAPAKRGSVLQWFPQTETSGGAHMPSAVTSVSSSVLGEKTTNAVSQAVAVKIVRQQAAQFCETLHGIDERIVELQKCASETMRIFQDARARDAAQNIGRQFALRNKGRLEQQQQKQQQQAETPADQISAAQQDLLQRIQTVVEGIEPSTATSAVDVVKALLSRRLKDAVEKGAKEAEQIDVGQTYSGIVSTDSARFFNNKTDAAIRLLINAVKEQHGLLQASVKASTTASAACVSKVKDFTQTLKNEMRLLASEMKETKEAVSQMNVTVAPIDPDTLVARATALAEKGDWRTAFVVMLEADDITALLDFLGSKVCEDNINNIGNPESLPFPTFISLCLQLSFELAAQPSTIPLRTGLLQSFYVEWDDTLKEMKQKAKQDVKSRQLFEVATRELTSVAHELNSVDDHGVDRKTRNHIRLLKKLLASLFSG